MKDFQRTTCFSFLAKKLAKRKHKDSSKKNKSESSSPTANKPSQKDLSVLELLELQARARAIRSQLALEPVAKIEVDSGDEEVKQPVAGTSKKIVLNRAFGKPNRITEKLDPPEPKQKSLSPDIVPIIPSTVTLCISDSDEGGDKEAKDKEANAPKDEQNSTEVATSIKEETVAADMDSDRDDVISIGDVDIIDLDNSDVDVGKDEV